jgi:hypothetical protein
MKIERGGSQFIEEKKKVYGGDYRICNEISI